MARRDDILSLKRKKIEVMGAQYTAELRGKEEK